MFERFDETSSSGEARALEKGGAGAVMLCSPLPLPPSPSPRRIRSRDARVSTGDGSRGAGEGHVPLLRQPGLGAQTHAVCTA
ncbi:hypothetical protein SKAU_G00335480 [Synaphobranchus kaupii]|uniref:Uncharacterized protein n=1 Tax=Synaphobranchus kaupii TaxID=118154 RepID=A0A9Q1EM45_SYNKA|nr:hypothetical protein SKAU_G00335480 [Synaphobranchus kaupii]